ncbi:MAG: hypothetical protein HYV13_01295 [Candidatus Doudnabacteria bacterium]|nr:hypothetical protein [Candidatus Doudnabacteria bacterium]
MDWQLLHLTLVMSAMVFAMRAFTNRWWSHALALSISMLLFLSGINLTILAFIQAQENITLLLQYFPELSVGRAERLTVLYEIVGRLWPLNLPLAAYALAEACLWLIAVYKKFRSRTLVLIVIHH